MTNNTRAHGTKKYHFDDLPPDRWLYPKEWKNGYQQIMNRELLRGDPLFEGGSTKFSYLCVKEVMLHLSFMATVNHSVRVCGIIKNK